MLRDRRTRVAVIGTGMIATRGHIPAYLSNMDVDLVAVVDIDEKKAQKAAKRFAIKHSFSSIDEMVRKVDVDAVSVCTPPDSHANIVAQALQSGAHVLCEKPLALNTEEARKIAKAYRARERTLMVGFNRRFVPNYQKARKWIREGRIGHPYCVEDHVLSASPLDIWGKSEWYYKPDVGGVLLDLGSHVIDMLNFLFGDFPEAVTAHALTHLHSPVEESCVLVLDYPENRTGVGLASWLASTNMENTAIHGTAQDLHVSPSIFLELNPAEKIPEIALWRKTTQRLIGMKFPNFTYPRLGLYKKTDPLQLEIESFIRQVRDKKETLSNALDGLNVVLVCDAARRSIRTGRKVKVAPWHRL